ncbi:hypothetical protein LX64_00034 [Chitinophaga skermanii]|uniref:IPExxxVDY family protein n=1 Tax=Chitinophaga skermanii TaxID=331697 RepID=A0A327R395_9BACT|nr:IPExxxVDY family protein [Chitinophaga skermanii]RAJ10432.1 hypothetical protein LX64_00034 [Chitinophaga skermanii]
MKDKGIAGEHQLKVVKYTSTSGNQYTQQYDSIYPQSPYMSVLKLKLDQDQLVEDFFDATYLVGLVSSARDFQLVWQINRELGYNFRVNNSLEVNLAKNNRQFFFTVYEFQEHTKSVSHYFYNNHCQAEFLLPDLKNIDYLWLVKGNYYQKSDIIKLVDQLRKLGLIQLVTIVETKELKHKMNLIF